MGRRVWRAPRTWFFAAIILLVLQARDGGASPLSMNTANLPGPASTSPSGTAPASLEAATLGGISGPQWRSGIAAWLGWTFDGLDMHLYTLVAVPFVAELLRLDRTDPRVGHYGSIIQAAFLLGWALGGGFFGRIGDRLGRSKALCLTVLTYAAFTGLSVFAQTWWHLLLLRFVAALGIGGEWAVGASLLSETWPRRWRPWLAAILQSGVNLGVLGAVLANFLMNTWAKAAHENPKPRYLFLVGVLPALLVFWIRRAVPETDEWHRAKAAVTGREPGVADLFSRALRRTTLLVVTVCAVSLTAHWAFMFWHQLHLRLLPEVQRMSAADQNLLATNALYRVMISSIAGNFFAAWVARWIGYRQTVVWFCFAYCGVMLGAYGVPRSAASLLQWLLAIGFCQGVFGLFTMYLPPLFPTLLRTTGAGFCYNIGRVCAAFGTVFFGLFSKVNDHRQALFYVAFLFVPAGLFSLFLPRVRD